MAKEIRFGKVTEEYTVNGEAKKAYNDYGLKAFIDWEKKELSVIDVRTGKWVNFYENRSRHTEQQPENNANKQPSFNDDIPF